MRVHTNNPTIHHHRRWIWAQTVALLLAVFYTSILSLTPLSAQESRPGGPATPTRTTSSFIGSAMAVLATLEEASVLPPEGTKEANQIIKSVIQLQSTFTKSSAPAIQQFLHETVQRQYGVSTESLVERFRAAGWTAEVLVAFLDPKPLTSDEDRQGLAEGLRQFNLSVDDLTRFLQLVQDGQRALAAQGKTLTEAYNTHRQQMPGR